MQASWNDTVLVEDHHNSPEQTLKREYVTFSNDKTTCPWNGEMHNYTLLVNVDMRADAVWYYHEPCAHLIQRRVAFWRRVKVKE